MGDNEDLLAWHEGDMPYSRRFDDHYYSKSDGRAECRHVFLAGNGLPDRWHETPVFRIGELGFGTGLNVLETWRIWKETRQAGQRLELLSFEAYPLARDVIGRALSRWPELSGETAEFLRKWPEEPEREGTIHIALDPQTDLTVLIGEAPERIGEITDPRDAWFLDGFAPARNPAMWSAELMQAVHDATRPGGTFATYTAAGWVRRNLQAAGFTVEKRPGHGGKREMMCGVRAA
jgi:tRNA U34 5-methylaminomethyl-2-thiouridine-forming methyltransferase MnmC